MVVSLNFKANTAAAQWRMSSLAVKQVPFAVAKSLTLSAKTLVEQNKRDANVIFQRPTARTRNAFFIPAKKFNPRTIIKRKDMASGSNVPPSKQNYLETMQDGGARRLKAFENALRTKVKGADRFRYATPTRNTRLNMSGNVTRNQIQKILAETGKKDQSYSSQGRSIFLSMRGNTGVFQRMARNKLKKILHLTNVTPSYSKEYNFSING